MTQDVIILERETAAPCPPVMSGIPAAKVKLWAIQRSDDIPVSYKIPWWTCAVAAGEAYRLLVIRSNTPEPLV